MMIFLRIQDQMYEGIYYKNFRQENYFTNNVNITTES